MFGKSSKPQSTIDSLIGITTIIEGDVVFSGGLRIDGQVKGNVVTASESESTNSTLVVSESARIQGEIRAQLLIDNWLWLKGQHLSALTRQELSSDIQGTFKRLSRD